MAEMSEIERLKQVKAYFERYYQFEDAVKVNLQNKEYLKSYIRNQYQVEDEFDFKKKIFKAVIFGLCVGVVSGLLMLLITRMWLVAAIVCGVFAAGGAVLGITFLRYKLSAAVENQREVNEGIKEQIAVLESRDQQLIRQRDDYYRGLKKRVDFMSLDYMDNIDQIEEILVNGEAETCEDAVAVFEQKLLFQEMSSFLSATPSEPEVQPLAPEKAKEMFGDPMELIRQNHKKYVKEKKADSIFSSF